MSPCVLYVQSVEKKECMCFIFKHLDKMNLNIKKKKGQFKVDNSTCNPDTR